MVEMAVAMLVMSILMTLVVSGMDNLIKPALQTRSIQASSEDIDLAFLKLDSEVRYASAVWAVNTNASHNNWNIEFESTFNGNPTPTCTELQYTWTTGQLSQATWPDTSTSSATPPTFGPIGTGFATGTSASVPIPFTINPNATTYQKVQLMVTLTASAGTGSARETTSSSIIFTAINTTSNAVSGSPDCSPTGWGY